MSNTPEQEKYLDHIIDILRKWRKDGIPPASLARLWQYRGDGIFECYEISEAVTYDMLSVYIQSWTQQMQKDLETQDSPQKVVA